MRLYIYIIFTILLVYSGIDSCESDNIFYQVRHVPDIHYYAAQIIFCPI